jgi:hypothetical protein
MAQTGQGNRLFIREVNRVKRSTDAWLRAAL